MSDDIELIEVFNDTTAVEQTEGDNSRGSEDVAEEPEDEGENDKEEVENEDGEFIVQEITNIRLQRGVIQFKTIWDSDGSTTWEPIESFPGGLDHVEIQRFKEQFPEKFEDKIQKHKKRNLTNKLWTYVPLEDEEERHEKVDASATTREAKALYDPNRLEDPDEAFLKNYDTGCRVSRSKSREMRKNIESSSADSSLTSKTVSPEKKKPAGRGGRKKKVEGEEGPAKKEKKAPTPRKRKSEETATASPAPTPSPAPSSDPAPAPTPTPAPEPEPAAPMTSSAPSTSGPVRRKPVARGYKLNSSDSSDEEVQETQRRKKTTRMTPKSAASTSKKLEKPTDVVPPAPTPIPISKLPAIPKKAPAVAPPTRKRSLSPEEPAQESKGMDALIRYNNDTREEEESKKEIDDMFGPDESEEETFEEYRERDLAERRAKQKSHTLDDAITVRSVESCELILMKLTPEEAIEKITNSHPLPLHEVIAKTWDFIHTESWDPEHEEQRKKQVESVFRAVFPFLPVGVLAQVNEDKNTLLNLAINTNDKRLVEFLCAMGSPFDIPNVHGASAIESALMNRLPNILEVLLQYGGTFHYYVGEHLVDFQGEHLNVARTHLLKSQEPVKSQLLGMLSDYYKRIEAVCKEVRGPIIRISHRELDFGPIVCLPRSKMQSHINRVVEFKMPNLWVHCSDEEEFKLVVIPMAWHEVDKRFYGSPFATKMQPPRINNVFCEHQNGIIYDATAAMFEKKRVHEELVLRKELNPKEHIVIPKPTLCNLHIQFDPMEPLGFVACQLIRCLKKDPSGPSTFSALANPSPQYSTPRYSSPGSSGPPATPRI